jgi:transposase
VVGGLGSVSASTCVSVACDPVLLTVPDVMARLQVSRHTVYQLIRSRQLASVGLAGLSDRSSRPRTLPGRTSAEAEALICELRRNHPSWGVRRLVWELTRRGYSERVVRRRT